MRARSSGATAELRKADAEGRYQCGGGYRSVVERCAIVNWVQLGSKAVAVAKMF